MKKILSLLMVMVLVVGCGQGTNESVYNEGEDSAALATDDGAAEDTTTDSSAASSEDNAAEETADNVTSEEDTSDETATSEAVEPVNIKVVAPYGTPVLSMVKMFVENPEIADGVTVEYEALQAADVLSAELINKNADIAIVPTNLAAVLNSKGVGYKIAGATGWGSFYLASSLEVETLEDLKGETITVFGQNLTPDVILRYVLTENGINPDEDVTLEYFTGASELATNYIAGQSDLGMIPQPVLTNVLMKRDDTSVVIDLQEEWAKITGSSSYPQACLVVSEDLINNNPDVVEAFLAEFDASVDWVNENGAEAGAYYEGLGIGLNAAVVEKSLPACNLDFVATGEARQAFDTYFDVLFQFNPQLTGGAAVDEAVYFEK